MRPVLLGMNNPHSEDPRHALAPYPAGVSGHRLWRMLHDVCPEASRSMYMRVFDRRNLLSGRRWDPVAGREAGIPLWKALEGRTVLVCGQSVANALNLYRPPVMTWRVDEGVRWCEIPHPSGLNRWYNDPTNRLLVGLRLEDQFVRACEEAGVALG